MLRRNFFISLGMKLKILLILRKAQVLFDKDFCISLVYSQNFHQYFIIYLHKLRKITLKLQYYSNCEPLISKVEEQNVQYFLQ